MHRDMASSVAVSVTLSSLAIAPRAAHKPCAGKPEGTSEYRPTRILKGSRAAYVFISVAGHVPGEGTADAAVPRSYLPTTGERSITPEAGIAIVEQRAEQAHTGLYALEDLARHHGIPPGMLRGQ
jgi:hypothetical protein